MVDGVDVSAARAGFLNVAVWVTVIGVLCAATAGALTAAGGWETTVRPVAFVAMVCAVVAVVGAVLHSSQGAKALFAVAAVATLIAASTFFGLTFPS